MSQAFSPSLARTFSKVESVRNFEEAVFRHYNNTVSGSTWNELYHTLHQPMDLKAVTLYHVKFKGHIIICGNLVGVPDFILKLRSKRLREIIPIVILHSRLPDEELWRTIGSFPEVYFMLGTPPQDLRRAGANSAERIVFLYECVAAAKGKENFFRDAQNIIATRVAEVKNRSNFVMTEFGKCRKKCDIQIIIIFSSQKLAAKNNNNLNITFLLYCS